MTTTTETPAEALERIQNGQSVSNYSKIITEFAARGIPEDDICPRSNVLTFKAWKALGRSVKKGEKGVKICTFRPVEETDKKSGEKTRTGSRPWFSSVFHVSQTCESVGARPMGRKAQRREAAKQAPVIQTVQSVEVLKMQTGSLFG